MSCIYLAIVPLPTSVSLERLQPPNLIFMESYAKAFENNLNTANADKKT